jgi:hypothetical protein
MKRFHIHVGVTDLEKSVQFYSTLFGRPPTKLKADYAKWMIEDPRLNFAISTRVGENGVDHLGIQVESAPELAEITERLKQADLGVYDEGQTTCCYAESDKAWVKDPSGLAWEAYQNMAEAETFGAPMAPSAGEPAAGNDSCCASDEPDSACCG